MAIDNDTRREQKRKARDLFVREGKSIKDIAGSTGIPTTTLYRWAAKHDWDTARTDFERSNYSAVDDIKEAKVVLARKLRENPNPANADALFKVTLSENRMEQKTDVIGTGLQVIHDFANYIMRISPEDGRIIEDHIDGFTAYLRGKYHA